MLNPIVQILLTVFGSGAVSSAITLVVGRQFERSRWLRDQQLEASAQFLKVIYSMSWEMARMPLGQAITPSFSEKIVESEQGMLTLIAPRHVLEAAQAVTTSLAEWVRVQLAPASTDDDVTRALIQFRGKISDFSIAVRKDLGTGKRDADPS